MGFGDKDNPDKNQVQSAQKMIANPFTNVGICRLQVGICRLQDTDIRSLLKV